MNIYNFTYVRYMYIHVLPFLNYNFYAHVFYADPYGIVF
jgi:hypothetical protein